MQLIIAFIGPLWLIFKFAENGSLLEYLHHHRTNKEQVDSLSTEIDLPNDEKLRLAKGIAKGMQHVASIKVKLFVDEHLENNSEFKKNSKS